MSEKYYPPLYGEVECGKCDRENCNSRGKFQRNNQKFAVTDGRCPRLPDLRGFVDKSEREDYENAFPLVHAELGSEDALTIYLKIPGEKNSRKIYWTKSGYIYFNDKMYFDEQDEDGNDIKVSMKVRRVIGIWGFRTQEQIIDYMNSRNYDYCIFQAYITGGTV